MEIIKSNKTINCTVLLILSFMFESCVSVSKATDFSTVQKVREYPTAVVRLSSNADTIQYDNLRFLRVYATSAPEETYVEYPIEKLYISYEGQTFSLNGASLTKEARESLYQLKSTSFVIDSVLLKNNSDETVFNQIVDRRIFLDYPIENNFDCMDSGDHYEFKELLVDGENEIIIRPSKNKCNIIEFSKLGSISHVRITSKEKVVYQELIKNGYLNINHFFNFSNYEELDVAITGDFLWSGKITIEK